MGFWERRRKKREGKGYFKRIKEQLHVYGARPSAEVQEACDELRNELEELSKKEYKFRRVSILLPAFRIVFVVSINNTRLRGYPSVDIKKLRESFPDRIPIQWQIFARGETALEFSFSDIKTDLPKELRELYLVYGNYENLPLRNGFTLEQKYPEKKALILHLKSQTLCSIEKAFPVTAAFVKQVTRCVRTVVIRVERGNYHILEQDL